MLIREGSRTRSSGGTTYGHEELGRARRSDRVFKFRRHHAEHRIRAAFERDRPADDAGVGAESSAPQSVREHRDLVLTVVLVLRRECAAEDRWLAQHGEKRRGDPLRAHLLGLGAGLTQRERAARDGADRLEDLLLGDQVDVVLRGEAAHCLRIEGRPASSAARRATAVRPRPVGHARRTAGHAGRRRRRPRKSPCSRQSQARGPPERRQ